MSPTNQVEVTPNDPGAVLAKLRGQKVVLPNLHRIFEAWPKGISPHYEELRQDADKWLKRYELVLTGICADSLMMEPSWFSYSSRLRHIKAADFAYLGATWWPYASYERLKIVTYLTIWVRTLYLLDRPKDSENSLIPRYFVGTMVTLMHFMISYHSGGKT